MQLILFDIDGTLIDSGGAGSRSMVHAFREVLSVDFSFDGGPSMAGRTDSEIIRTTLVEMGISTGDGVIPSIVEAYLKRLPLEMGNGSKHMKPGVRELLDRLISLEGISLGLLTGNIEEGARIKLDPFGLNGYFPFGAYGSDHEDRNKLLPIAVDRLRELRGLDVPFSGCVVVGDTPKDVHCALPYGARSVAVATGSYGNEELRRAGAHMVLDDLMDAETFIDFLAAG